jgi:hypothetical protein
MHLYSYGTLWNLVFSYKPLFQLNRGLIGVVAIMDAGGKSIFAADTVQNLERIRTCVGGLNNEGSGDRQCGDESRPINLESNITMGVLGSNAMA